MGFKALERLGNCSIGKVKAEVVGKFRTHSLLKMGNKWGFASLEGLGTCSIGNVGNSQHTKGRSLKIPNLQTSTFPMLWGFCLTGKLGEL
jgi:hypothetical protein